MSQIRIFIAGEKASAGKSSVCLGILGNLLKTYSAQDICYVKPATQNISPTLTAKFCQSKGIKYRHVGPIVYYKGFTREFLEGKYSQTSEQMLGEVSKVVDEMSKGKSVVVIDGVGYPSVGSVCGVSNADIAKVLKAYVIIIGKSGVGDAIDSYNLCATYFQSNGVPVLGGIFNRLSLSGFYSLDNCKAAIENYFSKSKPNEKSYGFVPVVESLAAEDKGETCPVTLKPPKGEILVNAMNEKEEKLAQELVDVIGERVNISLLLQDASKTL
eukprot:c12938_g1_i1.p1 GENE.c12938_g1_i1~~c12938_g1_i1.p1  ORF type:complete len:281 (+),score=121.16 c12938_g1_i1:33-845(+)